MEVYGDEQALYCYANGDTEFDDGLFDDCQKVHRAYILIYHFKNYDFIGIRLILVSYLIFYIIFLF